MEATTVKWIPDSARVRSYDMIINIIGFFLFGLLGIIVNLFILVVIRKNKVLQTSCFLLICAECVFSIFSSTGFFYSGIREGAILIGLVDPTQTRVVCYLSMSLLTAFGIQGGGLITVCVAMDRLISILCSTAYRRMGRMYPKACWLLCFTYAGVSSICGIFAIFPSLTDNVKCSNVISAVSRGYLAYHGAFGLIFSGLCIFLYAAMLIAFKWRKRTITDSSAAQAFLKQQRKCMPTVKLLMIIYGITSVTPEIGVAIITWSEYTAVYIDRVSHYISFIKTAAALAEIIGLYFGSRQFRKCAKTLLGMGSAPAVAVAPVTTVGGMIRPARVIEVQGGM